jgi:hypothetical protein
MLTDDLFADLGITNSRDQHELVEAFASIPGYQEAQEEARHRVHEQFERIVQKAKAGMVSSQLCRTAPFPSFLTKTR